MARIKLSPLISSINGKLGSAVFQNGNSGIILREKVTPRNRRTSRQVVSRNRLTQVKGAWQELSDTDRNSWIVLSTFFKQTSKNNTKKFLSPYQLFIQFNVIRLQGGFNILLNTALETAVVENVTVTLSIIPLGSLRVFAKIYPLNTINWVNVYISRPFKPSQSIAKSEVRYVGTDENDGALLDVTIKYKEIFTTLPVAGDKVLVKLKGHLESSGWTSKDTYIEVIIS